MTKMLFILLMLLLVFVLGYWLLLRDARMLSSECQHNTGSIRRLGLINTKLFSAALFLWGWACCGIMLYYIVLLDMAKGQHNAWEFGIGVGYGFFFGIPSWIGLPIVVFLARRILTRTIRFVLLLPAIFAIAVLFLPLK